MLADGRRSAADDESRRAWATATATATADKKQSSRTRGDDEDECENDESEPQPRPRTRWHASHRASNGRLLGRASAPFRDASAALLAVASSPTSVSPTRPPLYSSPCSVMCPVISSSPTPCAYTAPSATLLANASRTSTSSSASSPRARTVVYTRPRAKMLTAEYTPSRSSSRTRRATSWLTQGSVRVPSAK